ncbi:hypothetical protein K1W54_14835 [Micromonospora sp. CPCC 205371]|nr:hypothetical protein [Micromonospora sp. CPCC 205371]
MIVALGAWWFPQANGPSPTPSPHSPSTTSSPTTLDSAGGVEEGGPPTFEPQLTVSSAVVRERCHPPGNTGTPIVEMTPKIAGTSYTDGFGCGIGLAGPVAGYLDFLVPKGAQKLVGVAGLDDRSPNVTASVRFSITSLDEKALFDETVAYGRSAKVDLDLGDQSRIRIKIQLAEFVESPMIQI